MKKHPDPKRAPEIIFWLSLFMYVALLLLALGLWALLGDEVYEVAGRDDPEHNKVLFITLYAMVPAALAVGCIRWIMALREIRGVEGDLVGGLLTAVLVLGLGLDLLVSLAGGGTLTFAEVIFMAVFYGLPASGLMLVWWRGISPFSLR